MTAFSKLLDQQGRSRADEVLRDDGTYVLTDPAATDADARAYQAWLAAGGVPLPASPAVSPVREVTGRQINGQARAAGISAALATVKTSTTSTAKPDDLLYVTAIGLDTLVPIDNPKVARVLALAGVSDVPGFMKAALTLQA